MWTLTDSGRPATGSGGKAKRTVLRSARPTLTREDHDLAAGVSGAHLGKGKRNLLTGACSAVVAVVVASRSVAVAGRIVAGSAWIRAVVRWIAVAGRLGAGARTNRVVADQQEKETRKQDGRYEPVAQG